MSNRIDKNTLLDESGILASLGKIGEKVREILADFEKFGKTGIGKGGNTVKSLNELTFAEEELAKQAQQLGKLHAQLETIEKTYTTEIIKTTEAIRQKKAAIKEEITGTKAAAAAKKKAAAEEKAAIIAVRNAEKAAAAEKKRIEAERRKEVSRRAALSKQQSRAYIAELKKQEVADKRAASKKKGLSAAFNNLAKSALGLLTMYVSLQGAGRLLNSIFSNTKELDSLNFAITSVITNQQELAESQAFLSRLTESYGAELISTTNRYIKFFAAAKQSKTSLQETQKIFESVTKVSATLGLKTDELTGVYLALEQMMSKGTVTTEELRRQLGERIPGAVAIMAKAVGVSTSKLSQMMKMGQVMSAEVLPKFAEELEKSFGVENITRVDTMQTSVTRMKLAWQELVKQMETSSVFTKFINKITGAVRGYSDAMTDSFDTFLKQENAFKSATDGVDELIRRYEILTRGQKLNKDQQEELESITRKLGGTFGAITGVIKEYDNFGNVIKIDTNLIKHLIREQGKLTEDARTELIEEEARKLGELTKMYVQHKTIVETGLGQTGYRKGLKLSDEQIRVSRGIVANYGAKILEATNRLAILRGEIEEPPKNEGLFDLEKFEKELKKAQSQYEEFNKVVSGGGGKGEKDELTKRSDILQKGFENEKGYLKNLLVEYKDNIDARIAIFKRLSAIEKKDKTKDKTKDDTLAITKERQKGELAETEKHQQELLASFTGSEESLLKTKYDFAVALLEQQKSNLDEQLKLVEKGSLDEIRILTDKKEIESKIAKELTEFNVKEATRKNKELEKADQDTLSNAEAGLHEYYLTRLDQTAKEIADSKGKAAEIKRIDDKLTTDLINNEIERLRIALKSMDSRTKAYKQTSDRIAKLEEQSGEESNKQSSDTEQIKQDLKKQTFDKSAELLDEGFNLASTIYDRQLSDLDKQHEFEVAMAGKNVEDKLIADRKYEKEKAKIQTRQAIAEKAQAALSIALNTASAIISIWAQVPKFDFGVSAGILTGIVAGIGALQLGAVLAAPIPSFEKGGDHKGGIARVSEKGSELLITEDGSTMLTPEKESVLNLPAGHILPHDETQRWLANYAMQQSYDIIDMSQTNNYLKSIDKNLKNKRESGVLANGDRYIKRGHVTTKIRQ